jgi:hypothetical protein
MIADLEPYPRRLPHRAYFSLTEAATWIVEDDCRNDDYLIEQERRALESDSDGGAPEAENQEIAAIDHAYDRFYALLSDECSAGRIVLEGLEYREEEYVSGEHTVIPTSFFLRPVFHGRGSSGTRLKGELGPDVAECCDAIVDGEDRRPCYGDVRIRPEGVEKLVTLYGGHATRHAGTCASASKSPVGRPKGISYAETDETLARTAVQWLETQRAGTSANAAARQVSDQITGQGSIESKQKRLARKINELRRRR